MSTEPPVRPRCPRPAVLGGSDAGTAEGGAACPQVAAACFQILAHAFTKPLLFVSVGRLAATVGHDKQLSALRGSAWNAPLAGIGFGVGALSMVGIPLFGGFAAKVNFAGASIFGDEKLLLTLGVLALSSILNALYYIPALIGIWSSRQADAAHVNRDGTCALAIILLIAGVLFLGGCFSPVMDLIVRGLELM